MVVIVISVLPIHALSFLIMHSLAQRVIGIIISGL